MQDLSAIQIQGNGYVRRGNGVYDDVDQHGDDAVHFLSTHVGVGYADVGAGNVDAGGDADGAKGCGGVANALGDSSAKDAKDG